ncbi:MAG: substrate-binding domain-containing protein [Ostreibacterium sp.]
MEKTIKQVIALALLASTSALLTFQANAATEQSNITKAKAYVKQATQPSPAWTGPTTGPKAQKGKVIVYVSSDQRDGGQLGVGEAVNEAAKVIGWTVRTLDGQGSVSGRSAALQQAIALKPDGIVLAVDDHEQAVAINQAIKAGIKIVGWHTSAVAGASPDSPIFTNITTDPLAVAKAAAAFVVADSGGKAKVVIFTDSTYEIAIAKSDAMAAVIKACKMCTLLSIEDTPLANSNERMPGLTNSLLQRYGDKWTYSLSINDLTFDFMAPSLISAGKKQDGFPRNLSAGNGSVSAFQRIKQNFYQYGTVAEPLNMQGWQAVDELNRAFSGEKPSGFVPPVHLVIPQNVMFDGGKNNVYNPDNGYKKHYKKIWGVQ